MVPLSPASSISFAARGVIQGACSSGQQGYVIEYKGSQMSENDGNYYLLGLHRHVFFQLANDSLEGVANQNAFGVFVHGLEKLQEVVDARRFDLALLVFHVLRQRKCTSDTMHVIRRGNRRMMGTDRA